MRDIDKAGFGILLESIVTNEASEVELVEYFEVKNGRDVHRLCDELQRLGFLTEIRNTALFKPTVVLAAHRVGLENIVSTFEQEIILCEDLARRFGAIHDGWEAGTVPEYYEMKDRY